MILSVHQPQYLPWIGYFDKIIHSDAFIFLDNVQYKKREFQNRNKIRTKENWIWLTLPVITKDRFYQKISDVEINNETDWAADHLKSIEYNYAHAPFFKQYHELFRDIYSRKWQKLSEINVHIINLLMNLYGIRTPISFESSLAVTTTSSMRIIDICKKVGADTYLSGAGGKAYIDEELFRQNNIKLVYQEFKHPVYPQQWEGFEPFMSIIDHLFNRGPQKW